MDAIEKQVLLPVDDAGEGYLVADLGEITLKNRFETEEGKRLEFFDVEIKAMNLQEHDGNDLMERVDIALKGQRELTSAAFSDGVSRLRVLMKVCNLRTACSIAQWELLFRIWKATTGKGSLQANDRVDGHLTPPCDDIEDDFVEASEVEPWLQQRDWQFSLDCSGVAATMRGIADDDIASLHVQHVMAECTITTSGSQFGLRVSRLELLHLASEAGQLSYLLSSSSGDDKHLIAIKCISVSPEAAHHPDYDTWWDFVFCTLAVNWNDKAVTALMDYYRDVENLRTGLMSEDQMLVHDTFVEASESVETEIERSDVEEMKASKRQVMHVTASIEMLSATLMREGLPLVRLAMTAAKCKHEQGIHGCRTSGKLGNFAVEDLRRDGLHFREKLGLRDKSRSVIEFEFQTYDTSAKDFPGYEYFFSLEMSSTRLVYVKDFVEDLRMYIEDEPLIRGIMGKTASAVAESAKKAADHHLGKGLSIIELKLTNPLLVLPVDEAGEEHLAADLGEITLKNSFETHEGTRTERFEVCIKAMNLQEGAGRYLMENVDIALTGKRSVQKQGFGNLIMELRVSDLNVAFSDRQCLFAERIFRAVSSQPTSSVRTVDTPAADTITVDEAGKVDPRIGQVESGTRHSDECVHNSSNTSGQELRFVCTFQLHGAQVRAILSGQDGEADTDVAACRVSGVQAKFSQSKYTSEMRLNVTALEVIDLSTFADQRYKFLSSKSGATSSEHLVAIKRVTVSPHAPNHPGYDTWWDFDFRTLNVNWNDSTIRLLMHYFRNVQQLRAGLDRRAGCVDANEKLEDERRAAESEVQVQEIDSTPDGNSATKATGYIMHVTASIEMLSATLMRGGLPLVRLAMTAAKCKHEQSTTGSKTSGKLGNFVVDDLRRADLHFVEKLGLRDKSRSVIEFEFQTYDTSAKDFPGYEYFFSLEMSSTRLVYVKDFIEDLRIYMSEEPLMSGIMGKTASAVAESAKKAVGNRRQGRGLTKVELKVVNPLVMLPVDESGEEHLVVDLGEITLKNRFEIDGLLREEHFDVEIKAMNLQEGGGSQLMENVDMCLKGLSRSALQPPASPHAQASAASGTLGFEVDVDFSEMCANLSPAHLVLMNSLWSCNFVAPCSANVQEASSQTDMHVNSATDGERGNGVVGPKNPQAGSSSAMSTTMLVSLRVKKVKLSLLEVVEGRAIPHTVLALENPSVSYGITARGDTHLACSVMKLGMVHAKQAASPAAAVLRYYAEAKHLADGRSSMPQLHFEYTQSARASGSDLKISLFRPEFVFHPSTVIAVHEYMVGLMQLLAQDLKGCSLVSEPPTPTTPAHTPSAPRRSLGSKGRSTMRVKVQVRKPRITVVEDAGTDLKTKVVLQSTIAWQGQITGGQLLFQSCRFSALELFVSSEDDEANMRSVVDPFDMEFGLESVPLRHGGIDPGECTSIVISSAVEAQLSYQDWVFAVLLFSSWQQCWLQYIANDANTSKEESTPSTLIATPVASQSRPAFTNSQSTYAWEERPVSKFSVVFRCTQIGITVINDCFSGSHMPVLEIRGSDMDGFFGPSNGAVVFQTNVSIEIDYFNMEIAEWEPFLEFWPLSISRWSTSRSNSDWRIRALRSGNMNLTLAFLDCLSLNGKTLFRALETLEDGDSVLKAVNGTMKTAAKIRILHPYHVRNEIGVTIHCSSINDEGETLTVDVEAGLCMPMDIRSSRRNQRKRLAKAQLINVGVGDSWEKMEIRIDRVGKQNLVFKPVDPSGTLCRVICNVQLVEGSKHVVLTSSVRVVNKTWHAWSLLFDPDGSQPQEGGMLNLLPLQTLSVPVPLVAHCCLRVQPTERHNWSAPLELRKPPRGPEGQASSKTWLYNAGAGLAADSSTPFFVWVRMSSPDLFLINVTLTPICTITNQLAVPVSVRLNYGEKEETCGLAFGKSKSGPAIACALPDKLGKRIAPTSSGTGMRLTPVQEDSKDRASSPAGGHEEENHGPDRVFGPYPPGGHLEMYHFSPEDAVHMQVKIQGLKWSNFARVQLDRRLAADVELHREVVCCDDDDHQVQQLLSVSIHNFVIRDRPSDAGRDRRISLSCPYWIKNMTGLPLSFCLGSPYAGSADHEMAMATPRMLQNVQMPDMMKQMPTGMMPSSAGLRLPAGLSAPQMPSMPSMSLPSMMTPRGSTSCSYSDSDTMMAGLRAFHDAEQATRSVSHGLVEQPLHLGAVTAQQAAQLPQEYPALMFSFTATKKKLLFVKVAGSQWSDAIPISDGGASGMVEIANQDGDAHSDSASTLNFLFQLSLTTSAKSGPHHKTEVLTLRPRFVIVNRLDQTVHYRQMGTMGDSTLRSEHKTNFHWPDANAPFELCFRLLERDDGVHADVTHTDTMAGDGKMQHDLSRDRTVAYHWSGGCDIAMLGESHLRLRPIHEHGTAMIMRIEVKNHEESLHVVLHPETTRTPPYRIVNRSSSQVVVSQELSSEDGVQTSCDQVAPNASMPYAWDNPLLSHLLAIQVAGVAGAGGKMVVSLDAIGKTWSLSLLATDMVLPRNLVATVKADGPTKILTITDDVMISLLQDVHAAPPGIMTHFNLAAGQLSNPDDGTRTVGRAAARAFGNISLSVSLDRVSITLVDKHPQELLSATFNSVSLVYMRGVDGKKNRGVDGKKNPNEFFDHGRFRSLDISVRTFQLDNMLLRTPYPVAVYSSRAMKEKELFFELSVLEDLNDTVTNVPILKKVQAGMQDLELNVEGRLVLQVYMYHVAMMESLRGLRGHGLHQHAASADEQFFAPSTARRIYFELFSLPAVNLNFSFARRDLGEEDVSTALEVAQAISWLAASVDNAPLNLKTLELQHAFLETSTLLVVMREHYQKECLRQLYRIVGSVEVLGNPVGLFRNLGTGFRAFGSGVSGLRHGDQQSFKDGTKTLMRHGTHGLSNTISKVSSSVSRGVASVALDADFLRLRDEQKDNKVCLSNFLSPPFPSLPVSSFFSISLARSRPLSLSLSRSHFLVLSLSCSLSWMLVSGLCTLMAVS